jgi:(S)-2-hydroxy-acid oxidase
MLSTPGKFAVLGAAAATVIAYYILRRRASSSLDDAINLADLREMARSVLTRAEFDYFEGGAEDEITLRRNAEALGAATIWPRVLTNVTHIDISVELLNMRLSSPVGIAPVAMQQICHEHGECAVARACASRGVLHCLSQQATISVEDTAAAGDACKPGSPRWFQMYVLQDRAISFELARRAKASGCTALVVTVDAPVLGRRERDQRNRFALRRGLHLANTNLARPPGQPAKAAISARDHQQALQKRIGGRDSSLDWEGIAELRAAAQMPIVVKGLLTYRDAVLAINAGVAAVWVSNHGGRQLGSAPSTLIALREVVAGVAGRAPVLVDGGFRRGSDVFKALAVGAQAVFVGRPVVHALSAGGEQGVSCMLHMLDEELRSAMALAGTPTIAHIQRTMVQLHDEPVPRPQDRM